MDDPDKTLTPQPSSEVQAGVLDATAAKTAPLPRIDSGIQNSPVENKDEQLLIEQSRILQRLAANAPLGEILKRLVLLIEAQSPGMLCSVLLLSEDGDHLRHGAAPSLPKEYVEAIDGEPVGPKHGSCGTAIYRGEPAVGTDILNDPLWGGSLA